MPALTSAKELLGIVLLRFRIVPRIWAILLVLVNVAAVFFLDTLYGQAALAAIVFGVVVMVAIHMRCGFVRLLGIGHILWIPMLIWFAVEIPTLEPGSLLRNWMTLLLIFNSISLIIDAIDVMRYVRGERAPHYTWNNN